MDENTILALESFRSHWWKCRQAGLKFSGKLPPMSQAEAMEAIHNAIDHYYLPCSNADLSVSKQLRHDTITAIEAAKLEYVATNQKQHRRAEIVRLLMERDGQNCWVCANALHHDITVEHKIALANGGTWAFDNLALAHRECNHALGRLPARAKEAARKAIIEGNAE